MAKGFSLIVFLCYMIGNCVSTDQDGIELYILPNVITDTVEEPTLHCMVDPSKIEINLDFVHIYHNGTKIPSSKNDHTHERVVELDTSKDYSGIYTCHPDEDNRTATLTVIIYPTCIELDNLNETIVDDFSSRLNDIKPDDLRNCLKDALSKIVNLTVNSSLDGAPSTDPPQTEGEGYNVAMQADEKKIPPEGDLVVWCNVTDLEGNYTFSWFWAVGDGYNFNWPPGLSKTNATSENHYSKFHASSAKTSWSGRFFCLVEKKGSNDAPRLYHVDVEVAYPIQNLYLFWNGMNYTRTVPIEISPGTTLEMNCAATGKWNAPAVNMLARIGEDQQIVANESSSVSKNKTTTAKLKVDWSKINGKDVKVVCEAKDHGYTNTTSSEVVVTNKVSLHLIWNGTKLNETTPIKIPHDAPLKVSCNATGDYATPEAVEMSAQIDKKPVEVRSGNSRDPKYKTTTTTLTIPWKTVNGKGVKVFCEMKGDRNSNPDISSILLKVSSPPLVSTDESIEENSGTTNSTNTSFGIFTTPTVFGGIATVLLVVVVIGVLVVAYRSRDKLRSWIMEKDVSKAALRKARYARARGGRGWIKYAKLPRDISEAMSHNE